MQEGKKIAAGVLPICKSTGRILLVRRSIEKGNTWAMFGGKFDPEFDHSGKDIAKREFEEESGYCKPYEISKNAFYVNDNPHIIYYSFIGLFDEEFTPCGKDHDREHTDFGWFDIDKLPENLHTELKELFITKRDSLEKIINKHKIG